MGHSKGRVSLQVLRPEVDLILLRVPVTGTGGVRVEDVGEVFVVRGRADLRSDEDPNSFVFCVITIFDW